MASSKATDNRRPTTDGSVASVVGRPSSVVSPVVRPLFPFSAIVGQDRMKRALLLNAVNPSIGGVLIRGEKGTAKSTAVRALTALLPRIEAIPGCPYACAGGEVLGLCATCTKGSPLSETVERSAPLVNLPLGATEDRVLGTLDLERAIQEGRRFFEPGLLAAAHRGVLYIDEVNLLSDHLVDVLLDTAAMGVNVVEREGISVQHPSQFMLVGTMNPEEGELRPQLLDRFGLAVEVVGIPQPEERAEIVRRRIAFEADPAAFLGAWEAAEQAERERILSGREKLSTVRLSERMLDLITRLCAELQVDGMRADIVIYKTAMTLAAYNGRDEVTDEDVREAAELALPHRRRRGPFHQPQLERDELDDAMSRAQEAIDGATGGNDSESSTDADGLDEETFAIGAPAPITLPDLPRKSGGAAGRRATSSTTLSSGKLSRVSTLAESTSRSLALGATLRAAAPHQQARETEGALALQLRPQDVRVNERSGQASNLVLFVVDSSGSMAAQRRMEAVKGAALGLLTDAYQKRDRVGLIAFRGRRAELLLPPTTSVDLAERRLSELPTGGRTPLADGLRLAIETLERAQANERAAPLLVLITDGRPNVALNQADPYGDAELMAEEIARRGIAALVIDTEDGRLRLGLGEKLARSMAAPCIRLDEIGSGTLLAAIRGAISGPLAR